MKTIVERYFRITFSSDGELVVSYVEDTFDLSEYIKAQMEWAKQDLLNRHGVKQKKHWNDQELDMHPDDLIAHFVEYHGDEWFQKNIRPGFIKSEIQRLDKVNLECLSKIKDPEKLCQVCDLCLRIKKLLEKK